MVVSACMEQRLSSHRIDWVDIGTAQHRWEPLRPAHLIFRFKLCPAFKKNLSQWYANAETLKDLLLQQRINCICNPLCKNQAINSWTSKVCSPSPAFIVSTALVDRPQNPTMKGGWTICHDTKRMPPMCAAASIKGVWPWSTKWFSIRM